MSRRKPSKTRNAKSPRKKGASEGSSESPRSVRPILLAAAMVLVGGAVLIVMRGNLSTERQSTNKDSLSSKDATDASFELPTKPEALNLQQLREEMIAQAKVLETEHTKTPAAMDLVASVYYDLNNLDEAERVWKKCIALGSPEPDAYVHYSRFLNQQDRSDEAIELLKDAHSRRIESAGTYHQLALAHDLSGQPEKACEISEQVDRRFPDFSDSRLLTGAIQNRLGRFDEAEKSLQKALELGHAESEVWPTLIPVLVRVGKREQASQLQSQLRAIRESGGELESSSNQVSFQERFESSLRLRAARLYRMSSVIEKRVKNFQEAKRLLSRSIQLDPHNPISLGLLVDRLVSENRVRESISVYHRLIEVQPENTNNYSNLASLAYRAGERQLALNSLQAGLQLHPEAIGLQIPLARLYLELNEPIRAREIAQNILAKKQVAEAWSIVAASYESTGEREKAEQAHLEAQKTGRSPIKN